MYVLLLADDSPLARTVHAGLEQQGHAVVWVHTGAAAERAMAVQSYAALVLDIEVGKQDGLAVLRKLRASGGELPVLMLVAPDDLDQRVAALEGADDFILKPVDVRELEARLSAVLRRAGQVASNTLHGMLKVNSAARTVMLEDRAIVLTVREFAILTHLLENRGRVISKQQMQEALYSWSDEIESNTVEVHVHHLRRKLGRELIKTMHGMGYMIDERVRMLSAS